MKTTAVIGGNLGGIAVAHMLQKKGIPQENIALFEESPGGDPPDCSQTRLSDAGKGDQLQLQPDGPFRRQLYREMDIRDDKTSPSSEAPSSTSETSFSIGHYVWKDSTSLSTYLLAWLMSPLRTTYAVWVYTWFVSEATAFLAANSVGKTGIKEFCMKGGYDSVWKEYLVPMVTLLWGVAEEDAGMLDAGVVLHFMHEKNLLQVWSPHLLTLSRSKTALKQLISLDDRHPFT